MSPARHTPRQSKILIVDDHPMVRERLTEVIEREPDLRVCGEAEDAADALAAIERSRPDLVIVDLTLKNSYGLDLIKDIRVRAPSLAVLVVSMHDESLHAERVIRAGARGYITKQEATKSVLKAIRTVLEGGLYLSAATAMRLASRVTGQRGAEAGTPVDVLTDRELRVFQLIGQGKGTRRIAEELRLHVSTIETYRSRIKEKLNLRDADELRQQAIGWVRQAGEP